MTATDLDPGLVRVLIVDDSALMRKLLADLLRSAPEIDVVGSARDSEQAIALTRLYKPDVITLDVEMPGRSGLDVLPELLAIHDASVIMVSVFTKEGADVTLTALERGAIDFFPKPDRHQLARLRETSDQLVAKVLGAARARGSRRRFESPPVAPPPEPRKADDAVEPREPRVSGKTLCLVIGISTGGPQALGRLVPLIGPPLPPMLIVQHMPAPFTGVFAERLNRVCSLDVKEAEEGDRLAPNRVLIAPGGRHMTVLGLPSTARIALSDGPTVSGHRPSVDVLFLSAAKVFGAGVTALIMTGMGRDGVEGCKRVMAVGGQTFGQDEATSAVYGMNKAAFLEGAVTTQFALMQFPTLLRRIAAES